MLVSVSNRHCQVPQLPFPENAGKWMLVRTSGINFTVLSSLQNVNVVCEVTMLMLFENVSSHFSFSYSETVVGLFFLLGHCVLFLVHPAMFNYKSLICSSCKLWL